MPPGAKGRLGRQRLEEAGRILPGGFREGTALLMLRFLTLGLQDCERINVYCVSPLVWGHLFQWPQEMSTEGIYDT